MADDTGLNPIHTTNVESELLGDRNGFRMAAYHRLDIGANFEWDAKRGSGVHLLTVGAYNAYNRRNPYFLFIEEDLTANGGDTEIVLKQASLFPVLPSFSYAFQF